MSEHLTKTLAQKIHAVPWELIVSFKTEVLSEHLIQSNMHRIQPLFGIPLKKRYMLDNDIHEDRDEVARSVELIARSPVTMETRTSRKIEARSRTFLTASRKLRRLEYTVLSRDALARHLERWFVRYGAVVGLIGVPAMVDRAIERVLRAELRKYAPRADEKLFGIVAHTDRLTETGLARVALLRLAQRWPSLRERQREAAVRAHIKKYGWTSTTLLGGTPLAERDVVTAIGEVGGAAAARAGFRRLTSEIPENVARVREAIRRYRFPAHLRELIRAFRHSMWVRTVRLEWMNQACTLARPLLETCADRLGITYDELTYMLPLEILSALTGGRKRVSRSTVAERMQAYAMVTFDGRVTHLMSGADVRKLKQPARAAPIADLLRGLPAYPGFVRGTVRILKDRTEISKLRAGEVLVTRLTTPDFLPAMQRAAAIVTDLGGITSHAAIVARELRKPCIVGTEHATSFLHEGDVVNVNAEKGIVRVLYRPRFSVR